jgi:hypothetical protein
MPFKIVSFLFLILWIMGAPLSNATEKETPVQESSSSLSISSPLFQKVSPLLSSGLEFLHGKEDPTPPSSTPQDLFAKIRGAFSRGLRMCESGELIGTGAMLFYTPFLCLGLQTMYIGAPLFILNAGSSIAKIFLFYGLVVLKLFEEKERMSLMSTASLKRVLKSCCLSIFSISASCMTIISLL